MAKVRVLFSILKKPSSVIRIMGDKRLLNWIPDDLYLKIIYRAETGKRLDLKHPKTYNEKLQWLKLYDRRPEYTMMVDKYEVRKYVAEKIGEEYLIPLIGVYDSVDEIPWEGLPDKFVLKCTHGSGSNIICLDKKRLDIEEAKKKLGKWMKKNWYWFGREWAYKKIVPRIICEEYLTENGKAPDDYKFMCFNGVPRVIQVHRDRYGNHTQDYYDIGWKRINMTNNKVPISNSELPKPENFDEMVDISRKLSRDTLYSRIDLYNIIGRIFFGEITLYPTSGFTLLEPEEFEVMFGDWISLENNENGGFLCPKKSQ